MRRKLKQLLSRFITLAVVVGMMQGMSFTTFAWDGDPYADLLNSTTTVSFDNKDWYLIENNSTAANAGTVTLLTKEIVSKSEFDANGSSTNYSGSTVEAAVNSYYRDNISPDAKTAVDGDKMFLLTIAQVNAITNVEVRKCPNYPGTYLDAWWLCTPVSGSPPFMTNVGNADGVVDTFGTYVMGTLGVRPALKLNLSKVLFSSGTNTFTVHNHNLAYSEDGATITATCTESVCSLPDNKVTLTIVAPTLDAYGGAGVAEATLTGLTDFNAATEKTISAADIRYVGREGTSYEESDTAPTNAGKYTAKVIVEGKTALVNYEIAKAEPIATAPAASATYGQNLANVTLTNPSGNTAGTWAFVDAGTTSVGNVGSHIFKANFTPDDTDNYKSVNNVDVTVTVDKAANPATVTTTATVTRGGNIVDLANCVVLNGASGSAGFEISGEAHGCTLSGSTLTSGENIGSVTVNITVAEDDNYYALAATPVTVNIIDKGTQTISAPNVTVTYGDTGKKISATTDGDGAITYSVKDGSEDYIDVNALTGELTLKKPGTATVVVLAAESGLYMQAAKEVTVTINKAAVVPIVEPDSKEASVDNNTETDIPKTGDSANIRLLYTLLIASFGGLGVLVYLKKKKAGKRER